MPERFSASFWATKRYSSGALKENSLLANFVIGEDQRTKTMSDASRRHVTLPALLSFFLRAMPLSLMKPWRKLLLVAAVCGFVGYVTVFVAPRRDMTPKEGILLVP